MDRREFLFAAGVGCVAALRADPAAAEGQCRATEQNPAGPFYLPEAPFGEQLAHPEEPGRPLLIGGRVLGRTTSGCTPLAGAVVDVWHASDRGVYYGLEGGAAGEQYLLRGRVRTDREGRYGVRTILPGHYPLSRTRYRPRHIHYRVSSPGHQVLVTQLYFRGDPHLPGDPLARPSLVTALAEREGNLHGTFDLVLAPEA